MKLELKGARAVKSKSGKNVYVRATVNGKPERCFFPNDLGVIKGELLIGQCEIGEQEYVRQEDNIELGYKKGDTFKRWDVMNFISRKDQSEVLKIEAEFKAASKSLQVEHKLTDADILAMIV